MILDVINKAQKKGACKKIDKPTNMEELVKLFFSPQGIEFCEENNFPDLNTFRGVKNEVLEYGIFVDEKQIKRSNDKTVALIGNTQGELKFDKNNYVNTVILMHGASAKITASKYTVLKIVNIGDCKVEIEKDNTGIVL